MKIVKPNVELIKQEPGLEGIFKQIEKAGRNCYKSESNITKESAELFVQAMCVNKHSSVLEHGTVYLTIVINDKNRNKKVHYPWYYNNAEAKFEEVFSYIQAIFIGNKYSTIKLTRNKDYNETRMHITTNYRVIIENDWKGIVHEFLSEPTDYHEKRITLKFTTNIGVTRESNRHRVNSIAEESTRFCNYSKDKFNNQITICKPSWPLEDNEGLLADNEEYYDSSIETYNKILFTNDEKNLTTKDYYIYSIQIANYCYNKLIQLGWTSQQAREVLPLATKSDVVYTATTTEWRHFFDLRLFGTTGKPHPNMEEVSQIAKNVLIENNLWDLIYNSNDKNC